MARISLSRILLTLVVLFALLAAVVFSETADTKPKELSDEEINKMTPEEAAAYLEKQEKFKQEVAVASLDPKETKLLAKANHPGIKWDTMPKGTTLSKLKTLDFFGSGIDIESLRKHGNPDTTVEFKDGNVAVGDKNSNKKLTVNSGILFFDESNDKKGKGIPTAFHVEKNLMGRMITITYGEDTKTGPGDEGKKTDWLMVSDTPMLFTDDVSGEKCSGETSCVFMDSTGGRFQLDMNSGSTYLFINPESFREGNNEIRLDRKAKLTVTGGLGSITFPNFRVEGRYPNLGRLTVLVHRKNSVQSRTAYGIKPIPGGLAGRHQVLQRWGVTSSREFVQERYTADVVQPRAGSTANPVSVIEAVTSRWGH